MRALVVYESMFGNTREVAERVAAGLLTVIERVDVRRVGDTDAGQVQGADLLVVGGPTHAHGMSRPSTREAAVSQPTRYSAGAAIEPGADGIGLREWFVGLPPRSGGAAAFDTRADAPAVLTGSASKGIARSLRHAGRTLVTQPQSFVLAKGAGLKAGEADRAERWGRTLAQAALRRSDVPSRRQDAG